MNRKLRRELRKDKNLILEFVNLSLFKFKIFANHYKMVLFLSNI